MLEDYRLLPIALNEVSVQMQIKSGLVSFKVNTEKPPISFEALCNRNTHTRWTLDLDGGGDGETVVVLCAERTAQQKRASSGVEAGGGGTIH